MINTRRYFDGARWTEHIAPGVAPVASTQGPSIFGPVLGALVVFAVIVAVVAYLLLLLGSV